MNDDGYLVTYPPFPNLMESISLAINKEYPNFLLNLMLTTHNHIQNRTL